MSDYQKLYIYTTGKHLDLIIFKHIAVPTQFQHPIPSKPVTNINENNVNQLLELTLYDTVDNLLAYQPFQDGLKNDWYKAFNEFGVEIDNYTSKLAPNTNFNNGDVVVWDANTNEFVGVPQVAGVSTKTTRLKVLQTIPANQSFNVSATNSDVSFEGDIPVLLASAGLFNADIKIQVTRNGTPQDKGTEVSRQSATNLSFDETLDVGEVIFIYSY